MKASFRRILSIFVVIVASLVIGNNLAIAKPEATIAPEEDRQRGQDAWNVEYVSQIGGPSYVVAIYGNYAYIGIGPRLVILDVSNPSSPVEVGKTDILPGMLVEDIMVVGDYAYVANYDGGLRIVNVTNPTAPVEVGFYGIPAGSSGVTVVGDYAYVTDYIYGGMRIVNVANPAVPVLVGRYSTTRSTLGLVVAGDFAYIADSYDGLRIVNVSNPAAPVEVGFYETTGYTTDVAVAGDYAYIADAYTGLWIVNVANPASPVGVGFYEPPGLAYGVAVSGDYVYVADGDGLRIVNVANPAAPVEVGFYDTDGGARSISVEGSYAYVAEETSGLQIVDVNNPAAPTKVGIFDTPGYSFGVVTAGDYAYTANGYRGLRITNVSNPAVPVEVGFYETPEYATGVAISGDYAYVDADYGGLRIVNVANPAAPVAVGFFDTPPYDVYGVAITGDYAYVAAEGGGLRIVNVSNPAAPVEVGFYDTPGDAYAVAVVGDYAYVAGIDLRIVNVANPAEPVAVGFYTAPGTIHDVAVVGDYAYIAAGFSLRIVNVANPAAPFEVGSYDTPGMVDGIAVTGDYVYIADVVGGLRIVNIANPAVPVEAGFYDTPGYAEAVAVAGDYVYVADYYGGFIILRFTGEGTNYSISGHVTNLFGSPLDGVTVSAGEGYTDITDASGNYTISNVITGTYPIIPSLVGYTFSPASQTVSVPPDAVAQDFKGIAININQFEVNQVLGQQKDEEQNYVAGKATALRVFLNVPIPTDPSSQKIVVKRNGVLLTELYPKLQPGKTDKLEFLCPTMWHCNFWQAGTYTFEVSVNGVFNQYSSYEFVERKDIRILAVPIRITFDGQEMEPNESWETAKEFLIKVYPISLYGVDWVEGLTLDATALNLRDREHQKVLWQKLLDLQPDPCGTPSHPSCYDQIIGFIPFVSICDENGCLGGWTWGENTSVVMTKEEVQVIVAHEIGHNYDLGDEYGREEEFKNVCGRFECGINPPPAEYCGREGRSNCDRKFKCVDSTAIRWDLVGRGRRGTGSTVIGSGEEQDYPYEVMGRGVLGDKLSFMGSGEKSSNYWITPAIYHHLFNELAPAGQVLFSTLVTETVVQASGWIGLDGTVQLEPWVTLPATAPAQITGTYTIEALDAADVVLASQGFEVSFLMLSDPPVDVDTAPFQVRLPFPADTASFQIKQGNEVLLRVEVSDNSPVVNVLSPNGGENWGSTGEGTITWSGSDVDGDELYYTVLYSPDGSDWVTIGANITTTQTTVALDEIPGGAGAKIQIIATDGINTSVDESDGTFTVGEKGPSAYILSPSTNTAIPNGTSFYLHGYAYDVENGSLGDASLEWSSSVDGYLGIGTLLLVNLSPGYHTITLTATDSTDASATDDISVYIGSLIYLPVVTLQR